MSALEQISVMETSFCSWFGFATLEDDEEEEEEGLCLK